MNVDYDIVISGGGMVGASLACALADLPLRIAVIEAVPPDRHGESSYDDRSIALSLGSQRIFETIGLWSELAASATPIKTIHVSDRGHFGVTRLRHTEEKVPALGYVVISRDCGLVLVDRLRRLQNIDLLCPAAVAGFEQDPDHIVVKVEKDGGQQLLRAGLLVAADGGQSKIRNLMNTTTRQWDYQQSAIIANVSTSRPHRNTAFERFTDSGPLAVLPLQGDRSAVVWTLWQDQVEAMLALDDTEFLGALQQRFGTRLGRFTRVGQRAVYPLKLIRANALAGDRVVVIGNAAHSLHPIAGQGFNLGLRDVAVLAETIARGLTKYHDSGHAHLLKEYIAIQQQDHDRVIRFTDGLVRLFSNNLAPVALARNSGMLALELMPSLKHQLARGAMGLSGRVSSLARGIPLTGL